MIRTCFFLCLGSALASEPPDLFNYDETVGNDYGPPDWNQVECVDVDNCPGWPTNWEHLNPFIPYDETENRCIDCSEGSPECPHRHKQSPVPLYRNITELNECKDRHRMNFEEGSCGFGRMDFQILRHALRGYQPLTTEGHISCNRPANIDFSWGFPVVWELVFTDISVPSQHTQDGVRYAAEVVLSHIYSGRNPERLIGNVAILLEEGSESDYYDFLDLYTRRWAKEARIIRSECHRRSLLETTSYNSANQTEPSDWMLGTRRSLRFGRRFNAYDWLEKAGTEYYFRYEGSQLVPPCLQTVHWRVMKNPIKVAPSQIHQLERLLATRIDPHTCQPNTAGKPRLGEPGVVDVNRPLQTVSAGHKIVFCECIDWDSKSPSDKNWCRRPMEERGVKRYRPT